MLFFVPAASSGCVACGTAIPARARPRCQPHLHRCRPAARAHHLRISPGGPSPLSTAHRRLLRAVASHARPGKVLSMRLPIIPFTLISLIQCFDIYFGQVPLRDDERPAAASLLRQHWAAIQTAGLIIPESEQASEASSASASSVPPPVSVAASSWSALRRPGASLSASPTPVQMQSQGGLGASDMSSSLATSNALEEDVSAASLSAFSPSDDVAQSASTSVGSSLAVQSASPPSSTVSSASSISVSERDRLEALRRIERAWLSGATSRPDLHAPPSMVGSSSSSSSSRLEDRTFYELSANRQTLSVYVHGFVSTSITFHAEDFST